VSKALNVAASVTAALAQVTGLFGPVFALIASICSAAAAAQHNKANCTLFAQRCQDLQRVLQSVQQQCEREVRMMKSTDDQLPPRLGLVQQVRTELNTAHELVKKHGSTASPTVSPACRWA
jgi:hypothetical protein